MSDPRIILLSGSGAATARKIQTLAGGRVDGLSKRVTDADHLFDDTKSHLQALFREGFPIIAVMASGAVIRLLAPVLADKHSEPQ